LVGWIILGVIVALLLLLLLIPLGVDLGYEQGEFHLSAKIGPKLVRLFPKKPGEDKPKKEKKLKKKKKKPEKEPQEDEEEKPKKKRSLPFDRDELLDLVRTVLRGIGKFGRAWHVDRFVLHYVAAGNDPYDTAMTYGWVNAALSSLSPLCQKRFQVRDCSVWTDVDFTRDKTFLELGLAMTITFWRLNGVINSLLFGALKILIRSKRRKKKEAKALKKAQKAAQTAPEAQEAAQAAPDTDQKEKKENIQEEERMAANG
jgi:hypothetical protein